jgi:hypothetical protein
MQIVLNIFFDYTLLSIYHELICALIIIFLVKLTSLLMFSITLLLSSHILSESYSVLDLFLITHYSLSLSYSISSQYQANILILISLFDFGYIIELSLQVFFDVLLHSFHHSML